MFYKCLLTINKNVQDTKNEIYDKKVSRLIQGESIKMWPTFFDDSVEFRYRGFKADQTKHDQNQPCCNPQNGQTVDDFGPVNGRRPVGGKEVHLGMRRRELEAFSRCAASNASKWQRKRERMERWHGIHPLHSSRRFQEQYIEKIKLRFSKMGTYETPEGPRILTGN